jgi:hypothetical protein
MLLTGVGVEKGLLGRVLGKIYLGCYEAKSSNQIPTFP